MDAVTPPGDLLRLQALLAEREKHGSLDCFGLLFLPRLEPSAYEETPRGCLPFAATGGDGVHFSLLDMGAGVDDHSPVVMTVPLAEEPNRLLGRNLREFLGLGRYIGYFLLEQLQYEYSGMVHLLDSHQFVDGLPDFERETLDLIARDMPCEAWSDHDERFYELEEAFGAWIGLG